MVISESVVHEPVQQAGFAYRHITQKHDFQFFCSVRSRHFFLKIKMFPSSKLKKIKKVKKN
jgi:hypothetical protein